MDFFLTFKRLVNFRDDRAAGRSLLLIYNIMATVGNVFITGINLVGAQTTILTVPYANLPKKDTDVYLTFYYFVVNIFIFVGSALGTWLLAWLEELCAGTGIYGSQVLTFVKAALYLCMTFYIIKVMPIISGKEHDLSTT